jgi:hypothetical protein
MRRDQSRAQLTGMPARVVVGVSGSVANLAALHAASALARRLDVPLVAVSAWAPVGGEINYRRAPCPQLLRLWGAAARDRLVEAFNDGFGGIPTDLNLIQVTVRGEAGPVLTELADQPDDLLMVGSGRRQPWRLDHELRTVVRHTAFPPP